MTQMSWYNDNFEQSFQKKLPYEIIQDCLCFFQEYSVKKRSVLLIASTITMHNSNIRSNVSIMQAGKCVDKFTADFKCSGS